MTAAAPSMSDKLLDDVALSDKLITKTDDIIARLDEILAAVLELKEGLT